MIKIVTRACAETNSSSSHAVGICMKDDNLYTQKDWNLDIRDGTLYIPGSKEFGWEYFKTNDPLTKIQYVCSLYIQKYGTYDNTSEEPDDYKAKLKLSARDHKVYYRLKTFLCKVCEVKDVDFMWLDDCTYESYDPPLIDHNSLDLDEEILESPEVTRHFILSKDSWLYGGNDNSIEDSDFKREIIKTVQDYEPLGILSIHFPEPIGRFDINIYNLTNTEPKDIIKEDKDAVAFLENLYYNETLDIVEMEMNTTVNSILSRSYLKKGTGEYNINFRNGSWRFDFIKVGGRDVFSTTIIKSYPITIELNDYGKLS